MAAAVLTAAVTSLNAQSAVQTGAVLDNVWFQSNHSIVVTTGAGVSAGVVALRGSHDGVNWTTTPLASITTAAASTVYAGNSASFPFRYLRADITTVISGGTVTATIASS